MAFLAIAGAVIAAVGAIKQGQAQSAAASYNANIAAQNAVVSEQQGVAAVEAQRRDAARSIGRMKALYGASGVQSDSGSPMDVLADSAASAELDALTTQYNYKLKGLGFMDQASLDRQNASNATTAGYINATSAVLRGASVYTSMSAGSTSIPSFGGGMTTGDFSRMDRASGNYNG